ncbi:PqqD family protein [Bacillus sp. FJAT-42376]|uniref:PqqD family protein n=1 Tax=Bacillus sp. FJAT-42376 TaxID=2014076 RepID=UPI000F4F4087|nr:PqqD family protein [Bacillus sp. FJAT-42376]AZB44637.1 PqqD family protein [Bacillus sp. FJAT-42376]
MSHTLTLQSVVDCSHLSIQPEGDEFSIGDSSIGEFLRVPEVAVDVVRLLDGKNTLLQVKTKIDRKYGEDVDVLDFVEMLKECDLIYKIDSEVLNDSFQKEVNPVLFTLGRIFFSRAANLLYVVSFAALILLLILHPALIPTFRDMFVFEPVGLSGLIFLVVGWGLTLIHEFAHLLAASKEKVHSKIRLNLRMIFLVAETDMTGLWGKPKKNRYVPFLAGMAWNTVIALGCFAVQLVSASELAVAFARMIALITLYGFVWQFIIFLRTDVYYVISNWKNTSAMHEHSLLFLRKTVLRKDAAEWEALPLHEKKNAQWFGILYIIGGFISVSLTLYLQVPAIWYTISYAVRSLSTYTYSSYYFWDSLMVVTVGVIELAIWLIGLKNARKDRIARRNNPPNQEQEAV